jgi:hypothetical protein
MHSIGIHTYTHVINTCYCGVSFSTNVNKGNITMTIEDTTIDLNEELAVLIADLSDEIVYITVGA